MTGKFVTVIAGMALASLASAVAAEDPPVYRGRAEVVGPALLADNLLGPDKVEQCFGRRGCTIPGLGARLAGLALDRCVDAVEHNPLPGDTEQCRTDNLRWTPID